MGKCAAKALRCPGGLFSLPAMTVCARGARIFLLLSLACSFLGCSQFKRGAVSEEKETYYLEAIKRTEAMDWDGAIEYFEKALQNNPSNSAAHFQLGMLYDMRKHDYGAAIYHYQKHSRLRPNTPSANRAEENIIACKRELAKTVSYEFVPRNIQNELERHAQTNALLAHQISILKAELARRPQYVTNYVTNFVQAPQFDSRNSAQLTRPASVVEYPAEDPEPEFEPEPYVAVRQPSPEPAPRVRETPRPQVQSPRAAAAAPSAARKTHRVRPGDTLEVVARQYGVSVSALKAANPSARSGTRAGQNLTIPN